MSGSLRGLFRGQHKGIKMGLLKQKLKRHGLEEAGEKRGRMKVKQHVKTIFLELNKVRCPRIEQTHWDVLRRG